jgi:hypothetical protein
MKCAFLALMASHALVAEAFWGSRGHEATGKKMYIRVQTTAY